MSSITALARRAGVLYLLLAIFGLFGEFVFPAFVVPGDAAATARNIVAAELFPFGILVIKSGFLPRILGMLLLVAGFAYLVTSATAIVLPAYTPLVSRTMMPLYFGEVPIIFWLLIKGAKVPQPQRSAPAA